MFTVAKCEVIFHDTQYERKPCVCALCSITVTSSGVITVMELKATASWALLREVFVAFTTTRGNSGQPFSLN